MFVVGEGAGELGHTVRIGGDGDAAGAVFAEAADPGGLVGVGRDQLSHDLVAEGGARSCIRRTAPRGSGSPASLRRPSRRAPPCTPARACRGSRWGTPKGPCVRVIARRVPSVFVAGCPWPCSGGWDQRCLPHTGQAPGPWLARTFSATRICSAFEACCGEPEPPWEAQVLWVNCRPP